MPADEPGRYGSQYGELEIGAQEPAGGMSVARYTWRPPPGWAAQLEPRFELPFLGWVGPTGLRRFAPAKMEGFVAEASTGGLAALAERHRLTPEQRFGYRVQSLIYRQSRGFREHLDRRFTEVSHLRADGGAPLLPDGVGRDARGGGEAWSIAEVLARGRDAGGSTVEERLALGLTEAARLDPLDPRGIPPAKCAALVRMALFDFGPAEARLDPVRSEEVRTRLLEAIGRHDRLEGPAFWKWLFDEVDNIVHGIAKRSARGVLVSRAEVRSELIDLAFEAHLAMADCVQAQMLEFSRSLPEGLDADERAHFSGTFGKRDYLGGLSIVLLQDRLPWLRPALLDLLDVPADPLRQGVVLRMLEYYGTLVRARRAEDVAAKSRGRARNDEGRPALIHTTDAPAGAGTGAEGSADSGGGRPPTLPGEKLAAVAMLLRDLHDLSCPCGTTHRWSAELESPGDDPDAIVIRHRCEICDHSETNRVTHSELRRLMAP